MKNPRLLQLSQNWFKAAKRDLVWAKKSYRFNEYNGVCFLSQQIFEKTLKALLFNYGENIIKIHYLPKLLNLCIKYDIKFKKFIASATLLTNYYIGTQYPDDVLNEFNQEQAKQALKYAAQIVNFADKIIKK